ncbi:MAG TPA: chemotaxis protein CheX [Tepidisphaeraceae bacterium]|nr:chemotaxis protein CheX [Tepidisphaeraceae bacterium]
MSTTTTTEAPKINPKLIVPFVNSVRDVFSTMVGVQTTVERPHVKGHAEVTHDVSSIIGFSGDVVGSVVVSFEERAAEKLVEAFAGSPHKIGTPDFADAIGELANMVAGAAKKDLGARASITVPSVIIGKGHQVARLSDVPCLIIPCKTPVGDFCVEVCIKQLPAK